jgi:hypothetical protein
MSKPEKFSNVIPLEGEPLFALSRAACIQTFPFTQSGRAYFRRVVLWDTLLVVRCSCLSTRSNGAICSVSILKSQSPVAIYSSDLNSK